jgi:hypothetical protein
MNAQAILDQMHANYAQMTSYQDSGVVITTWTAEPPSEKIFFTTAFRRPDRFMFEWMSDDSQDQRRILSRSALWSGRLGTFTHFISREPPERANSLCLAIAGATGISGGAAHTIPAMLMPEVTGFMLSELEDLSLTQEVFESTACYRILGHHPYDGGLCETLVGIDDCLLRQFIETDSEGDPTFEIHRDIRVNEPIDEQIFESSPIT